MYGQIDHFKNYQDAQGGRVIADPLKDFQEHFTYAYPNHYPQHKLNELLLRKLADQGQSVLFSHAYAGHHHRREDGTVEVPVENGNGDKKGIIECSYLVGADGTRSKVREDIGVKMTGHKGKSTCMFKQYRHPELCEHIFQE